MTPSVPTITVTGKEKMHSTKAAIPHLVTKAPPSGGMEASPRKIKNQKAGIIGKAKKGREVNVKIFFFFIISPHLDYTTKL